MDIISAISLALGSAWVSGINLYAGAFTLGLLGYFDYVTLPGNLTSLEHPAVIAVAFVLYCVEFIADKVPWFDSVWDLIHTFIRIPAGAALAAAAMSDSSVPVETIAGLIGGGLATSTHLTKASTRAVANVSPEPFTNWALSTGEDVLAVVMTVVACLLPLLALGLIALSTLLILYFLPRIWRLARGTLAGAYRSLFGANRGNPPTKHVT